MLLLAVALVEPSLLVLLALQARPLSPAVDELPS